jgi:hypothetical protein
MVDRPVARAGSFGVSLTEFDQPVAGDIAGTLPAVTGSASGTLTLYNAGTIACTLPTLTGAVSGVVANPGPVDGTIAGTLPVVTAALVGATVAGTMAGTLQPITAALDGLVISDGSIAPTLPAVTAELTGTHTPPAVTGDIAGILPALIGELQGRGGIGVDVAYAESVYRKRREREKKRLAAERALNKRIRQKLGLEPPDPEPAEEVQQAPLGPFFMAPDLASVPLRAELAALMGALGARQAQALKAQNEEALKAILAADDALPGTGIDMAQLEEWMRQAAAMGSNVMSFAQELQNLVGAAQGASDSNAQVTEAIQQLAQMTQQQGQMLGQIGQALMQMIQGQQQLMAAVKAPRKKNITVNRDPATHRVLGATSVEEGE